MQNIILIWEHIFVVKNVSDSEIYIKFIFEENCSYFTLFQEHLTIFPQISSTSTFDFNREITKKPSDRNYINET